MHFQRGWRDIATQDHLTDWVRVAALAYGRHRANGHASFQPGDLQSALLRVDAMTGEVALPAKATVSRAIGTAVANGFLARGSDARCLIVPAHIQGGLGNPADLCPVHEGRRRRAVERPLAA